MEYCELKQKHEKELNEFKGIFFAFSNNQFKEGMEKLGLTVDDTKKIYSLGAGGYILKEKSKAFHDMFAQFSNRMETALKEEKFLLDALTYELQNHEYCITGDTTQTFDALGLTTEGIQSLSFGAKVLKKARAEVMLCS